MMDQVPIAIHALPAPTVAARWRKPDAPASPARPSAKTAETVDFLDLAFDAHGEGWVLDRIRDRPPDAPFAYVVTPNVDHVVRLQRTRSDLWPAYRHAWMTLCDSRIIGKLAARAGFTLPVVPGSDLTADLFRDVVQRDDRVAFLGAEPAAVAALADRYGLTDVHHHNPPMGFIQDAGAVDRAVRFLVEARPRYSFLAVGSPQQELIAYRASMTGEATGVGFCVGASLDFLTGAQSRAPDMLQQLSLEWLFRLSADPRRMWRRYLVEGPAIFAIFSDWRRQVGRAA